MAPEVAMHGATARRGTRRRVALLVAIAVVVAVGAVALSATTPRVDTEEERTARDLVVDLTRRTAMASYSQDIGEFARAADAAPSGLTLIGIDDDGAFGHLTFAATLDDAFYTQNTGGFFAPSPDDWDPGPYCFRVAFDQYGKVGEFGTAQGIALVECPAQVVAVEPPPSDDPVLAPDASDVAQAVLAAAPDAPDADALAAEINDRLPDEHEGRPVAQATVTLDGSDIGVAMGFAQDCVLVARVDGTVSEVYPPRVYLEPGELGCAATTALADLRPPH